MRKAMIVTLIILATVVSLLASGCAAQKGLINQSLIRLYRYTALYNPVICQEVVYLHNQLAIYLKKTIKAETLSNQAGLKWNQNNKAIEYLNSLNLPTLKNNSLAAEIAYFYLADDDINTALCAFWPMEAGIKSDNSGKD